MHFPWVEKVWTVCVWLTPGRHHHGTANGRSINKHGGGDDFQFRSILLLSGSTVCFLYTGKSIVFRRHYSLCQTSCGPTAFGKVHDNYSLLSFILLRYHSPNASWTAGLKTSPRYGKGKQAIHLLQASKLCENRARPRIAGLISASPLVWHKRVSICVPWALWKSLCLILRPWTLEMAFLLEGKTDWTTHPTQQCVPLWRNLTSPSGRQLRHGYPLLNVDIVKVIQSKK